MAMDLRPFIDRLPKTELHLHIEGTLEPELLLDLAGRNGYELPFEDVDAARAAYRFTDLQSFLDIYYRGAGVLQTPRDFYDLMSAYLRRAAAEGVRHAEIFFDPQTHTERGVGFPVFMEGFRSAIADVRAEAGITADLIMCFLRHLSGEEAVATLREAEPHLEGVIAVGLDSTEIGRPMELFEEAYERARGLGLRAVAHAGEEGPPENITAALDVLGAERIDHGVRCLEDPEVVRRLVRDGIPLTVCPISNVAVKVVDRIEDHPLPRLIEAGITVTVNSDDPAYFGGYVGDNYQELADGLGLGPPQLVALARNSIEASFLDPVRKSGLLAELEAVARDREPQGRM
jgi:adenosine deaminase